MAEDAKAEELIEQLRDSFAQAILGAVASFPPSQALQLADALCTKQLEVLAGLRVRYRTRPEVDGEAIAEDWRIGLSLGEITAKHKVSRSAAYQHHPNRSVQRAKGS